MLQLPPLKESRWEHIQQSLLPQVPPEKHSWWSNLAPDPDIPLLLDGPERRTRQEKVIKHRRTNNTMFEGPSIPAEDYLTSLLDSDALQRTHTQVEALLMSPSLPDPSSHQDCAPECVELETINEETIQQFDHFDVTEDLVQSAPVMSLCTDTPVTTDHEQRDVIPQVAEQEADKVVNMKNFGHSLKLIEKNPNILGRGKRKRIPNVEHDVS